MACGKTEQEVIVELIRIAKAGGVSAPRVIVADRVMKPNSITKTVKFALVIPTNEVLLIDKLIFGMLDFGDEDDDIYFIGSNVNLQGDLEIDYLYFEAKIFAIKI